MMFDSIKGKSVLITGASTGIGAATAELFGQYGAKIGVHYRHNREKAETVASRIRQFSGEAELFQGDLLEESVRRNLVKDFVKAFGRIDILINNAGACYEYRHFSELNEEAWDKTVTLNAKAPFFLSRNAFEYMKENRWGRIINITSVAVKYGGANSLHYTASKGASDVLTVGFSREGCKYDILVNSIRCGVIDTSMHTRIDGYNEEQFQKRIDLIPLKRVGKPIDIARMALFLASDCGNFITGEIFSVAGGD